MTAGLADRLLHQVERDRADQHAGAEGQDQPDHAQADAEAERDQGADHQRGRRHDSPAERCCHLPSRPRLPGPAGDRTGDWLNDLPGPASQARPAHNHDVPFRHVRRSSSRNSSVPRRLSHPVRRRDRPQRLRRHAILSATAHRILRHRRVAKVAPLRHLRKVLAQGVSGHPRADYCRPPGAGGRGHRQGPPFDPDEQIRSGPPEYLFVSSEMITECGTAGKAGGGDGAGFEYPLPVSTAAGGAGDGRAAAGAPVSGNGGRAGRYHPGRRQHPCVSGVREDRRDAGGHRAVHAAAPDGRLRHPRFIAPSRRRRGLGHSGHTRRAPWPGWRPSGRRNTSGWPGSRPCSRAGCCCWPGWPGSGSWRISCPGPS